MTAPIAVEPDAGLLQTEARRVGQPARSANIT